MIEPHVIQTRGFHNVRNADGEVIGFQFRMSPRYYRGMWLSQFRPGEITVDGKPYSAEEVTWEIKGRDYSPEEMRKCTDVYWLPAELATVKVRHPGGLSEGYHEITVRFGWVCNYIAPDREDPKLGINFRGHEHTRKLLLVW